MLQPFKSNISKIFDRIAEQQRCREILKRDSGNSFEPKKPKLIVFDMDLQAFLEQTPYGWQPIKREKNNENYQSR